MKKGDWVVMRRLGHETQKLAWIVIASPNGVSVMVGFEDSFWISSGMYLGHMALMKEGETYIDLPSSEPIELVPVTKVHLLWHGSTLCGAHHGRVPREWPVEERWLALNDTAPLVDKNVFDEARRIVVEAAGPVPMCEGCVAVRERDYAKGV